MRLTESQLYAQYPEIDIEYLKEDPFAPKEGEQVVSVDLVFTDPEVFPIKRHPQFDDMLTRVNVDPIAGITSTLAHYSVPGMRGHVGIIMKPLTGSFRRRSLRFLPLLGSGLSAISTKHAKFFTQMQLARGWRRLAYFPIAFFMGGFRAWPGVSKFAGKSLAAIETESYDPDLQEEQQASMRSHDREDSLSAASDKVNRLMFTCNIRISVIAPAGEIEEAKREVERNCRKLPTVCLATM